MMVQYLFEVCIRELLTAMFFIFKNYFTNNNIIDFEYKLI